MTAVSVQPPLFRRCGIDGFDAKHVAAGMCGPHYRRAKRAARAVPTGELPERTPPRRGWQHSAACVGSDPDLFFPVATGDGARGQIAAAKLICRRCPVIDDCLTWALEAGENHGVWGGMSDDERRALRRRESAGRNWDLAND